MIGTVGGLVLIVGFVAWQMRGQKDFRLSRIFIVTFAAFVVSLPFVGVFWWLAPHDTDRHSPLLLAAVFVPIVILEALGLRFLRSKKGRKNDNEQPPV